jgi:hypothetical protein
MSTGNGLPALREDGAVHFETSAMLVTCWETYLEKGALAVRPERALSPLEQLEVRLEGADIVAAISLRCEVVHLDPQRALLRLLDAPPPRPRPCPISATSILAPPVPEPATPPPSASSIAPVADPAPSLPRTSSRGGAGLPRTSSRSGAAGLPRTSSRSGRIRDPKKTQEVMIGVLMPSPDGLAPDVARSPRESQTLSAPATAEAQVMPLFCGSVLRFASMEHLEAARVHLEGVGAVLAVVDGNVPLVAIDVRIAVEDRMTRSPARVVVAGATPGTVVVQAIDKAGFLPLLAEMAPRAEPAPRTPTPTPSPAPPPAGTPQAAVRALSLPRRGEALNPTTAAGILALPVARAPTDADLERLMAPLLLRWLRNARGAVKLEVTADDQPLFTAVFVDGREVRTPASLQSLGKGLSLPRLNYAIIDLPRVPQLTTVGRTQHLIGEVIRGLCARCEIDELQAAFPDRPGRCPRAVTHVVESLGMPSQHQRFVKAELDGSWFLDEVARAAVGGRTVWETLYTLELCQGLEWDEPPPNKKPRTGLHPKSVLGAMRAAPTDDEGAIFDGKDHFQVLGLHWSSSPSQVGPAVARLRSDYGPGGRKRPQNPAAADKLSKRIEEANRVLSVDEHRRRYRREQYNLIWPEQARLLVQKAKLAIYRKDFDEASDILEAAEDIAPSPEAKALLAHLARR